MGEHGHTVHVLKTTLPRLRQGLADSGASLAILARDKRWTSLAVLRGTAFDASKAARAMKTVVLELWYDDESGLSINAANCHGSLGAMDLSLARPAGMPTVQDLAFVEQLVKAGIIESADVLMAQLQLPADDWTAWVEQHGFERLLQLPWTDTFPELEQDQLRAELARAEIIRPLISADKAPRALTETAPVSRAWTKAERAILDVHLYYLMHVWNLNNWKLYYRYKSHLPPARRVEVDDLVSRIMSDHPEATIRTAHEAILDSIWEADDWAAAIKDPSILVGDWAPDGPTAQHWSHLLTDTLGG